MPRQIPHAKPCRFDSDLVNSPCIRVWIGVAPVRGRVNWRGGLSQFSNITEARAILHGLRRQSVMDLVRGAAFVAALLLVWVSLHPFTDLEIGRASCRERV